MAALSVISTMLIFFCFHTLGYAIQCGSDHHDHYFDTRSLLTAANYMGLKIDLDVKGSTVVGIMDAITGKYLVRLDSPHKGHHEYPHINFDFLKPNDPHTRLPEGSLKILEGLFKTLKTLNRAAIFYYFAMDAYDVYVCLMEDIKDGKGYPRTIESVGEKVGIFTGVSLGGYYGAMFGSFVGSWFGPVGTTIGGVVGGYLGACGGRGAGYEYGGQVGKKLAEKTYGKQRSP